MFVKKGWEWERDVAVIEKKSRRPQCALGGVLALAD